MASLFTAPQFDGGGGITPEGGLKLSFFNVGTLVQKATFTTESLNIANSNPVVSDGNGVFPEIWMAESSRYKVKLEDKNDILAGFGVVEVYIAGVTSSLDPPTANAGGTVDIITAVFAPVISLLTDKLRVLVSSTGPNTNTAPTFSPDGLTAATIVKYGNQALLAGDIAGNMDIVYNLSNNTWELLNPRIIDYIANAAGTVDAITASFTPAITSLVDKTRVLVRASGANTITNPTFAPNGLTAKAIVKNGNQALAIGDIAGEMDMVYNSSNDNWELLNPSTLNNLNVNNMMKVQFQTPQGVNGGSSTGALGQVSDLNTTVSNTISGASLSTSIVTLPAGDYYIKGFSTMVRVNGFRCYVIDTANAELVMGNTSFAATGGADDNYVSRFEGLISIPSGDTLRVITLGSVTKTSNGLGQSSGVHSLPEIFAELIIWKVA